MKLVQRLFDFDILDNDDQHIGQLHVPDFALSKSRPDALLPDNFSKTTYFNIKDKNYLIDFKTINRNWLYDTEFYLKQADNLNDEEMIAYFSRNYVLEKTKLHLNFPFQGEFYNHSGLLRMQYLLKTSSDQNSQNILKIYEPRYFSMKRTLAIEELDKNFSLEQPTKVLLGYLVFLLAFK